MSSFRWKTTSFIGGIVGVVLVLLNAPVARSQTTATQIDQPNRVSIEYVAPKNPAFQKLYDLLRDRRALEKIQEILSPFRLPEELSIRTAECGVINARYTRENAKPTVIICYEFLKNILDSLPKEATADGVTPADAAVGQFVWVTLHEVGHAIFDIFDLPIFGHPEDAADNFATYIMLQFGKGQARRLIDGAAWAWRAYVGDYQKNPVMRMRLAEFTGAHGLPQQRFYNLLCLAIGADPVQYADFGRYFPLTEKRSCSFEYATLFRAFNKEIRPHIDQEIARRVLDSNWLPEPESKSVPRQ
jgi:Putative metallopeptidase